MDEVIGAILRTESQSNISLELTASGLAVAYCGQRVSYDRVVHVRRGGSTLRWMIGLMLSLRVANSICEHPVMVMV